MHRKMGRKDVIQPSPPPLTVTSKCNYNLLKRDVCVLKMPDIVYLLYVSNNNGLIEFYYFLLPPPLPT